MSYRFVALALVAACGSASPAAKGPATEAPVSAEPDDLTCPVAVPGTSITVEDTPTGAALVFVTTGDLQALLARAQAFVAALHDRHADGHRFADMIATRATATVHDIDHGARIELAATNPSDISALQSEARMHAQHLATGSCKMAM